MKLIGQSSINFGEQVLSYQNYTARNGLSHHRINDVYQDSRNLYWISTRYGLNRFDGETFKVYTKEKHGLKTNVIDAVFEDKDGMIWIFTDENDQGRRFNKGKKIHVALFNPYTEQLIDLQEYLTSKFAKALKNLAFYSRKTLDDAIVLITKSGDIIKYHHRSKVEYQQLTFSFTECFYYQELSNTNFWVRILDGKQDKFLLLSKDGQLLQKYTFTDYKYAAPNEMSIQLRPIYIGEKREVICFENAKSNTLFQFFPTGEMTYLSLQSIVPNISLERAYIIYYDIDQQEIWLKAAQGVYVIHITKGTYRVIENPELSDFRLKDNQNFLWASSPNDGLFALQIHQKRFLQYAKGHSVRGIVKDINNAIWVCPKFIQNLEFTGNIQYFDTINTNNTITIFKDETGNIWTINSLEEEKMCLNIFEKGTTRVKERFCLDINSKEVWSLIKEQNSDDMWFGGTGLLFHFDTHTKTVSLFEKHNDFPNYKNSMIYQIIEYQRNKFYLVTSKGLFLMDKYKGIFDYYSDTQKGDFYLPVNDLHHLHIDQDSVFWIGTGDGGLIKWLPPFIAKYQQLSENQERFRQFTQADGLPSNVIHAVYGSSEQYQDGFLWLNTENGIAQFHKTTSFSQNYHIEDGIVHQEGNRGSHYQDENGRLYFGTIAGITAFHPKDFQVSSSKNGKNLHIIGLEQFNSSTGLSKNKMWELEQTNTIMLHSGARRVDIKVNLPFSIRAEQQFFTYQIEGYHDQPIHLNQSSFTISDLPFGKYQLSLKLHDSKGDVLGESVVHLISKPPFYLQWWFVILSIVLLVVSIFLGVKWRTANLKKQKELLEIEVRKQTQELRQLNATKDRFFGIIAHDLRGPLISLKGTAQNMDFLLRKKRLEQAQKMGEHISNATQHVNSLLDNLLNWAMSQTQTITYHPKPLNLEVIVNETIQVLKNMATVKQITLQTDITPNSQAFADKNAVATIIRNLVNNALKFTPNHGLITITIKSHQEKIIVKISDTGIGIPKEKLTTIFELNDKKSTRGTGGEKGTGLGLVLCKELVEQNGGEIWIEHSTNTVGQGTCVSFSLPKPHLK